MIEILKNEERGVTEHKLLECRHTFSFADYRDDERMGFHHLRVVNQDKLLPEGEFATHPHQNIEVLTYVTEGTLLQRNSVGEEIRVEAGQIQLLSAGTGILHSESNPSKDAPTCCWQFWIFPHSKGLSPTNQSKELVKEDCQNQLVCVASPSGREGSLIVNQKVRAYLGNLNAERISQYAIDEDRVVWLQMLSGAIQIGDVSAKAGDGLGITDESLLNIQATEDNSQFFLFDMLPQE